MPSPDMAVDPCTLMAQVNDADQPASDDADMVVETVDSKGVKNDNSVNYGVSSGAAASVRSSSGVPPSPYL